MLFLTEYLKIPLRSGYQFIKGEYIVSDLTLPQISTQKKIQVNYLEQPAGNETFGPRHRQWNATARDITAENLFLPKFGERERE